MAFSERGMKRESSMVKLPEWLELSPFAAKRIWVTAARGLADRDSRHPAHPKVSRAQLP
ncbi:hypothetical protein PCA10_20880 [Metapseudomonas resinovorans NBRC 106553]|uniref:Uncharacterized protein n=1 Tax=Metapseudomonas resinovorans NBRC 106553 TaxID=1245471 RepID=S6AHQ4_METRE|nr:hypothetical protein PCA10_20880 [Pseudomonas resinovorans NBRC 106553]